MITRHSALAGAAAMTPFFLADSLAVSAVQLEMLRGLARVHGRESTERELSAMIAAVSGGMLNFFIARTGPAMAFKAATLAIPVVGPFLRFGAGPAIVAAYTWALGEAFHRHFAAGGHPHDFKVERFREVVRDFTPSF
jgi:uncharacterized protein (DUF697 family)